jgi:hypothetical protein
MGRVVFETPRVAATAVAPDGARTAGRARCRVRVMDPEENAFGPNYPGSMRHLRKRLAPDGSFIANPPGPQLHAPEAIIPREVFDRLADAALVSFHWEFESDTCVLLPKSE